MQIFEEEIEKKGRENLERPRSGKKNLEHNEDRAKINLWGHEFER